MNNKPKQPIAGIYPIFDAHWLEKPGQFAKWTPESRKKVAQAVNDAAISVLQLRCKESGKTAFDFINSWLPILRNHCPDTAIIINDRVDLALYFAADGVHVGQDDLPVDLCRKLLGHKRIIGLSTHNQTEIRQASQTSADYIGFGPIYSTTSKTDTHPTQGTATLKQACQSSPLPVVAIGGINLEQLTEIRQTEATAAAMISGLWTPEKKPQFLAAANIWQQPM